MHSNNYNYLNMHGVNETRGGLPPPDLRGDLLYVLPCVILFLCFSVLLVLRLPRLGKRANLRAFSTFVRFVLAWICRFPLPLGVWEGLRFVIVALPGLFSYFFYYTAFLRVRKLIGSGVITGSDPNFTVL